MSLSRTIDTPEISGGLGQESAPRLHVLDLDDFSREEISGGRQRVLLQVGWTSEGEGVVPPTLLYRIELARTFDEWRVVDLAVPCPR